MNQLVYKMMKMQSDYSLLGMHHLRPDTASMLILALKCM